LKKKYKKLLVTISIEPCTTALVVPLEEVWCYYLLKEYWLEWLCKIWIWWM